MPVWLRLAAMLVPLSVIAIPVIQMAVLGQRGWWWWIMIVAGCVSFIAEIVVFRQDRSAPRSQKR